MAIFGVNDYSLKLVTTALDLSNIALILCIGLRFFRNPITAFFPALIYAFHPQAIEMAKAEQVHIGTMTFILAAVLCQLNFFKTTSSLWAFASGVMLALAGHVHPEIFAHFPIFAFFIWYQHKYFSSNPNKSLASFAAGFFSIVVFFFVLLGPIEVITNLWNGANFQHGAVVPRTLWQSIERVITGQYVYFSGIGSWLTALSLYAAITWMSYERFTKMRRHPIFVYFLATIFLFQTTLCLALISRNILARILYPFFPILIIWITYLVERFKNWNVLHKQKHIALAFFSLAIITSMGYSTANLHRPNYFKKLSDIIKTESPDDHYTIIAPILSYNVGSGYKFRLHLGDQVEYLYFLARGMHFENIDEIKSYLNDRQVNFVIWSKSNLDLRMIDDPFKLRHTKEVLRNLYGLTPEEFDEEREAEFWNIIFKDLGFSVHFEDRTAKIYKRNANEE